MEFKNWSRLDPKFVKRLEFAELNYLFDGDHALGNSFYVRKRTSIEDALKLIEERDTFYKAEKEHEAALENFKERASTGEISINLKDLNDTWFYQSEQHEEFWRVAFEIYKKQNN